jgi:basic membrane protein A
VAETADQAGALPLLQFALTEVFDQRRDTVLTLAGYRELGGLRGILSRRAESLYAALTSDEQRATMQVFLRLVRLGHGTVDSRRRVPLSDLTDLDLDPVALSAVLRAFGGHRLLSFDRDQASGVATVDVAHEALLREWDRLAGWIDRHRTALRRHETFAAAVEEWELSGRDADYLLSGSRLSEFEAWRQEGTLRLTGREQEFLGAGLDRQRAEGEVDERRAEAQRRLEGRARVRLVALVVAIAMFSVAAAYGVWAAGANPVRRVALVHSGSGALDQLIEDGFDRAVSKFGMVGSERLYDESKGAGDELRALSEEGVGLILVPFALNDDLEPLVHDFPKTRFVLVSPFDAPTVSYLVTADQEGAFLAGAAAALKSRTGTIGFVGGMDDWYIWPFEAGYAAGARAIDPSIKVLTTYLSEDGDPLVAWANPLGARQATLAMYQDGADVVFHAAGGSGIGVFEAAAEMSGPGRQYWAIGVDTDQYETVRTLTGVIDPNAWRPHILTSVIKRSDVAVYTVLEEYAHDEFRPGLRMFDLESAGVDLSYSGGYLADVRSVIEDFKAKIIDGRIEVPCIPSGIPPEKVVEARGRGLNDTLCSH